jgi:hypothetical protein
MQKMTVATYTAEIPPVIHSKGEDKEIQAEQRKAVLNRIQRANLPNGYNFLIDGDNVYFISPSKKRLHVKKHFDLHGWIDWFDLCWEVAENHVTKPA